MNAPAPSRTASRAPVAGALDDAGVFWIRFDDPERKVNVLSTEVMNLLSDLADAARQAAPRGLVFVSAKPGVFLAGADITLFEKIATPEEGRELARRGQEIFGRFASLPFPTAAAVEGVCLGGGLELALTCDWLIAASTPKTRLGLPEVQLGIIPGLGGTQRLVPRIGLPAALDLILTSRTVDARRAEKMGLADEACPLELLEKRAQAYLARGKRVRKRKWRDLAARPPLSALPLSLARKGVLAKTRGHYPAPLAAIDAVGTGLARGLAAGLAREAELFGKLAVSEVSRQLVLIFFLKERFAKPPEGARTGQAFPKGAVVGAGIMGGGIAHLLASHGMRVRLKDIAPESLGKALSVVRDLDKKLARGSVEDRLRARQRMERILPTLDNTGFDTADIVIEAVVENLGLKRRVFAELEGVVRQDAILATNTSSLPISAIASEMKNPERSVGIHFFNPVHKMPLVEVIPGEKTSAQTTRDAVAFVLAVGKVPVVVADRPGFLVNRILLPYVAEAIRCFVDGAPIRAIDAALLGFGMPMGPLELADTVGIDVGAKVSHILEEAFGERMRAPGLMADMEQRKWLGAKTGIGFYTYGSGKEKKKSPNAALDALRAAPVGAHPSGPGTPGTEEIVDRCILTMVNEAARCLAEKVVATSDELDLAMVFGTGFAPFRGGLWRYATARGLPACRARLAELATRYGSRFAPADVL